MIKKFKQYNESVRDLLVGPTEEEVLNSLKDLSPNELLSVSSNKNFVEGVEKALNDGAELNSESTLNSFRSAVLFGSINVAIYLINKGIDIYYRDGIVLIWAIDGNYNELVKLLLKKGTNFNKNILNNAYLRSQLQGKIEISKLIQKYIDKYK